MARNTKLARTLRKKSTPAERLLWSRLRGRQLAGFKFRRQHCIGNRIVDFFCLEARLAVELDGGGHDLGSTRRRDQARSRELCSARIRELRFWNNEVMQNTGSVLQIILSELERAKLQNSDSPSP